MIGARIGLSLLVGFSALGSLSACQLAPLSPALPRQAAPGVPGDGVATVHVALPRRLSAVAADIERISVQIENINETPYIYERSLDRAAITAGQDVTFSGLIRRSHYLTVKAYDAQARLIGQAIDFINISGTGIDQKTVRLNLLPTYTEEATTGNLTPAVEFPDLPTVGTLLATYPSPLEYSRALAADHAGAVWMAAEDHLVKLGASGQLLVDKHFGSLGEVYDIQVDPDDNVWLAMPGRLQKLDPDGNPLAATENLGSVYQFTLDGEGHPWAAVYHGVTKIGLDGTVLATFEQAGTPNSQGYDVAVDDARGVVWVHNGTYPNEYGNANVLARFSTDGTFLGETLVNSTAYNHNIAVHPDGHLWTFSSQFPTHAYFSDMNRIAPDGTAATQTPAGVGCGTFIFDRDGNAWVARGSAFNNLYKLSGSGQPIGVHSLPSSGAQITLAADGNLLVHGRNELYKLAP